jgi:streptomycin 6-kinase
VELPQRVRDYTGRWGIRPDRTIETGTSRVVFGTQGSDPVVLKVTSVPDERQAGSIMAAFDGHGMVRVRAWDDGAVLLEQLRPGHPLVALSRAGRDREACAVFAQVVASMIPGEPPAQVPTAAQWGLGFERYARSGDRRIPPDLVAEARQTYQTLCETERSPRLLHGDLHHFNILFDKTRGWLAIDPKGVIGELEFELGAWLRNPVGHPELFARPAVVEERVAHLEQLLPIDRTRTLAWAFAQGVLSGIWTIEDHRAVSPDHAGLALAFSLRRSF